jgi:serine/threonine-protein kinase
MTDPTAPEKLDAALAAAFGPDSGPPLPAGGSVVQALGGPCVQLREPATEPPVPMERPDSPELPAASPEGLQLHGEIARGGMGAVLKGRDNHLGRDIAVKVLLETHQGRTELVQRFVEEAQIAGQLQHPGVVPVYELGQFQDKRPYFTMKLVKGQTLAKLLAERKGEPAALAAGSVPHPAANPAGSPSDLPRFTDIFLKVCQTIAYAHARGVIHRDLKPSNIMVGNFGEVQVMDWGLAKVLKEGGVADEQTSRSRRQAEVSLIQTQRSQGSGSPESGSETRAGSVLGTPAYMAPEQARGDVDLVDERADVFGLGAILCEILTGHPAFPGKSAEAIRKAQTAKLEDAHARLDVCGADAELIALAKQCLAAEPWHRPRHAGVLQAEIAAYQDSVAQRLLSAELSAAEAKARALEERKRRKLSLALAASVIALVVIGAGAALVIQHRDAQHRAAQAKEEAERQRAAEAAMERAAELQRQSRWQEAATQLDRAAERLGDGGTAELREQMRQARRELTLMTRLDAARLQGAVIVDNEMDWKGALAEYAAAFREAGLGEEGEDAETVAVRVRALTVRAQVLAAIDHWALLAGVGSRRTWLLDVGRRVDDDPWGKRFRDPEAWKNRQSLAKLANEVKIEVQSPSTLLALGTAMNLHKLDSIPLMLKAQARYPDDFWLNFNLGYGMMRSNHFREGEAFCRAAVALRPNASSAQSNLAATLREQGRYDEALTVSRIAIWLDPMNARAVYEQGAILGSQNRFDEAADCFNAALHFPFNDGWAYHGLGQIHFQRAEYKEAIPLFQKTLEYQPNSHLPQMQLGRALFMLGKHDEALDHLREAVRRAPNNPETLINLGAAELQVGAVGDAIEQFRRAIAVNPRIGVAHLNLGKCLKMKDRTDQALPHYFRAVQVSPEDPEVLGTVGQTLAELGRYMEARELFRRCLAALPKNHPILAETESLLRRCDRYVALEPKLIAVLARTGQPADPAERLDLAYLCGVRRMPVSAVGLWNDAFAAAPDAANNLAEHYRYDAACAAALAAAGKGIEIKKPEAEEKKRFRKQALDWLRADLDAFTLLADKPAFKQRIREAMLHWQSDTDLAAIRDPKEIAQLPGDEHEVCKKLWADVAELLKKVQNKH